MSRSQIDVLAEVSDNPNVPPKADSCMVVLTKKETALYSGSCPHRRRRVVSQAQRPAALFFLVRTTCMNSLSGALRLSLTSDQLHNPWSLDIYGGQRVVPRQAWPQSFSSELLDQTPQVLPAACSLLWHGRLKPTYGLVSTRGRHSAVMVFDHVGPITRTVADAAIMLQTIAGYDPAEPQVSKSMFRITPPRWQTKVSSLRLGIPARDFFFSALDPEIETQ